MKERSVWFGAFMGLLLGFIGWIILMLLPRRAAA
jgi:hypothetical protein